MTLHLSHPAPWRYDYMTSLCHNEARAKRTHRYRVRTGLWGYASKA